MTGKDLIIYILSNNLENESVFKDGKFIGFLTVDEVAQRMKVGVATVYAWIFQKQLVAIKIYDTYYIPADFKSPLEKITTIKTEEKAYE